MARRGCDRSVMHGLNNNHTAVRLYSSEEGQPQERPIQRALQNGRRKPTSSMWINAMSVSRTLSGSCVVFFVFELSANCGVPG
jgi:hypothetical protein